MKQTSQLSRKRKDAPDDAPTASKAKVDKCQRTTGAAAAAGTATRASTVTPEETEGEDIPVPQVSHRAAKVAQKPNPWLGMTQEQLETVRGEYELAVQAEACMLTNRQTNL